MHRCSLLQEAHRLFGETIGSKDPTPSPTFRSNNWFRNSSLAFFLGLMGNPRKTGSAFRASRIQRQISSSKVSFTLPSIAKTAFSVLTWQKTIKSVREGAASVSSGVRCSATAKCRWKSVGLMPDLCRALAMEPGKVPYFSNSGPTPQDGPPPA